MDALDFIAEFHEALAIRQEMLPVYLEEISSTLASHAYKQGKPFSSAELAAGITGGTDRAADFQAIEHSMTEGPPLLRGQQRPAGIRHCGLPRVRTGNRRHREAAVDRRPPQQGSVHLQRRAGLPDPL